MVRSAATTVARYLAALPAERRRVIAAVRKVIRANLPPGYRECMNWGMINYEVPLRRYPDTYNGQPLCYVGPAAQKSNYALYLMCIDQDSRRTARLRERFRKAGKRLDMGKSCVRFRRLEDLPLNAIGEIVASTTVKDFVARYEASRRR